MYGSLYYGPQVRPWMSPSTLWSPTPPYEGRTLAAQTSMTPFGAGEFVPVTMVQPPSYLTDLSGPDIGDWLSDVVQDVTASVGNIRPGLRPGAQGKDVEAVQRGLIFLGFSVGPKGADGRYGSATAQGVQQFQLSKGLNAYGLVDGATADALNRAITVKQAMGHVVESPIVQQKKKQDFVAPAPVGVTSGNTNNKGMGGMILTLALVGVGIYALSKI